MSDTTNDTDPQAIAEHTADRLAAEATARDEYPQAHADLVDHARTYDPDDADELAEFVEAMETARELASAITGAWPGYYENPEDLPDPDDVEPWPADDALEIVAEGENSGAGWEAHAIRFVLGTGGPHVEVIYNLVHERAVLLRRRE